MSQPFVFEGKLLLHFSGWNQPCCCPQTAECSDARRISPTKQDSLFTKPARKRHQRTAYEFVLTVRLLSKLIPPLLFHARDPTTLHGVGSHFIDIRAFTKYVLFRQRKTSLSWSISTKAAPLLPKMPCTTTNSMARTKSRFAVIISSSLPTVNLLVTDYICQEMSGLSFLLGHFSVCYN